MARVFVTENLTLVPELVNAQLSRDMMFEIKEQAIERLADIKPLLRHMMEVKVVTNERRNFINIIIKKDYLTMIFDHTIAQADSMVSFCFFLSDKIEPYAIITAVHHRRGKLRQLNGEQFEQLCLAIRDFKKKFGIQAESYHYTTLGERDATESFVARGGASRAQKSHSAHFHLKMRIASGMLIQRLPVHGLLDLDRLRKEVEPVRYNYTRENKSWEDVKALMQADVRPDAM
mmetsp:Transcript_13804/g.35472  ORF Transcript_13804/g.35472 Transcript_13804/m.35472 type:complete len:232 (+) Transcript_13804:186-881(+)